MQLASRGRFNSEEFGFELKTINESLRKKYNLQQENALVVTNIDPNGEAYYKGIREGDIIKRVGTEKVTTVNEFHRLSEQSRGKGAILVLVKKPKGNSRFYTLNY